MGSSPRIVSAFAELHLYAAFQHFRRPRHMSSAPASPGFLEVFRTTAGQAGRMSFAHFMELALYHPEVGYYRSARKRVGYGQGTDFFTASTSGPVFGELVAHGCVTLLADRPPGAFTFVEIGAEPGGGILEGVAHPFAQTRTVRLGEPIALSGPCVVFSNELFDAQPFHRFVFRGGRWRELGVALQDSELKDVELPEPTVDIAALPTTAEEGYHLDAPLAAAALAENIAAQPWSGLFVACDYGKSWREITEACPSGTGRAYYRHAQSNDLLARPGEQDLTCHVCWDWISAALQRHAFQTVCESQEAFFVKQAGPRIAELLATEASRHSQKKLSLLQLLHPAHLGQKFQVLHGLRG
jgi:SAM-dependent MidA family methyltransferase